MTGVERQLVIGEEVATALAKGDPTVALESTIFSHLGLPSPANRQALDRVNRAISNGGATPALTALLNGKPHVGVSEDQYSKVCGPTRKVAARDIGVALAQSWPYGATTVSATLTLAQAAGIDVFATGGLGGVHRGWASSADISADLGALAKNRVISVSAGAKVFLDLPATLEYLETQSVPVLGWRCDEFPAFHAPSSGLPLTVRVETAEEVAAIATNHWAMGGGGIVVAAPVPEADGIALPELNELVDQALAAAEGLPVSGGAITPAVLDSLADVSDGRTVSANLALAENNAVVASEIAGALAALRRAG